MERTDPTHEWQLRNLLCLFGSHLPDVGMHAKKTMVDATECAQFFTPRLSTLGDVLHDPKFVVSRICGQAVVDDRYCLTQRIEAAVTQLNAIMRGAIAAESFTAV